MKNIHNKLEKAVAFISTKLECLQSIPPVLADRTLKISALSFLILFFGCYMGKQMETPHFLICSIAISIYGFTQAIRLLRLAEKKDYETIIGTIYEMKGRHLPGRTYRVSIRLEDGKVTQLLMDKRHKFQAGKKYRFYFNKKQDVLTGIKNVDAMLNVESFYGFEEME